METSFCSTGANSSVTRFDTSNFAGNASAVSDHSGISDKVERMRAMLQLKLGPEYLATRAGAGGGKLTYIEGWRVINLANEIFGFDGWSSEVKSLTVDFVDQDTETGRYSMGVTAIVRVWLREGAAREDIGYGKAEGVKSKGDALDKCKKEAVTDATKRALRTFGNLLGNCLYDKSYVTEISKMKATKPKMDCDQLYRGSFGVKASHQLADQGKILPQELTRPATVNQIQSEAIHDTDNAVKQAHTSSNSDKACNPTIGPRPVKVQPQASGPPQTEHTASTRAIDRTALTAAHRAPQRPPVSAALAQHAPPENCKPNQAVSHPSLANLKQDNPTQPPHRPVTAQSAAYFSEFDDHLFDSVDLDPKSYTSRSSGDDIPEDTAQRTNANVPVHQANKPAGTTLPRPANNARHSFVIDQSKSAPVSRAQLQSRVIQSRFTPGELPTLSIRGNAAAIPTTSVNTAVAISARAVPEIGEYGGGFASARGLKRQSPEAEEDFEHYADENASAGQTIQTSSEARPPLQELTSDEKGKFKRQRAS